MWKKFSALIILFFFYAFFATSVSAATYYVSTTGNDTNPGTSESAAWKSANKVNSFTFQPGDKILFQRGGSWTGSGGMGSSTLLISRSGIEGKPITFGAYGTGEKPIFRNPPELTNYTRAITVNASWIVIENLFVRDTHEAGVYIGNTITAEHVTVRNIEATNVGQGVLVKGNNHLITDNYIHDLHLVKNTPGGNDDMGAIGVIMSNASNVEISYNRIINAIGPSYDYVTDGGIVEWWGNSDNNYVHHNWGENSNGFFEVGGTTGNHALNNIVAYNTAYNVGTFSVIHVAGSTSVFGVDASFTVSNNTIVDTQPRDPPEWSIISFIGNPTANKFKLRNNIFYLNNVQFVSPADSRGWVYTHENNLYHFLDSRTTLGFTLGSGEKKADPLFVNVANKDFHLQPNSPAIAAGTNGSNIGAYEYTGVSCIPNCTGKACGDDGCGSSCGSCAINYSCTNFQCIAPTPTPTRTPTPTPTRTPTPTTTPIPTGGNTYYVSPTGNDLNTTTQAKNISTPWKTIQKAVNTVVAGDTLYVRGGEYFSIFGGWVFKNSGTAAQPIILANYPGEQVVIKVNSAEINYQPFRCWNHSSWQTPKADYIHLIGTSVNPHVLSNGVSSNKGIVIQGPDTGTTRAVGVRVVDCDYWEVAGIDFIKLGYGIFTMKNNNQTMEVHSPTNWYVHDNRVYGFWGESGMQFNGDYNRIENNEIYKAVNETITPYGCQNLNILGHHNLIKGNTLSKNGSTAVCGGLLFEWDLSDFNIAEKNKIYNNNFGIKLSAGDNNIIKNNLVYQAAVADPNAFGIIVNAYPDGTTHWPCNELTGAQLILPANDPTHPDYPYFYEPRTCDARANQIYHNVVYGYPLGIGFYTQIPPNTIIKNNAIGGWTKGPICLYNGGICQPLNANVVATHNSQENFGFKDVTNFNFQLNSNSTLINSGISAGVNEDFSGQTRPQGTGYDIGAYEYVSTCIPNCTNKACGDDGCGSSCGSCAINYSCTNFQCVAPTPTPVPPTPTRTSTPIPTRTPTPSRTPTPVPPTPTSIVSGGNTYYVSTTGNDANSGTQTSPWGTIQKAANTLNPGNTVIISVGTYNEKVSVSRSGIIFQASGLVNMKGFYITGNNTTVKGFSITNLNNTEENGIDARGSNIVIEQNIINDVPSNGIEVRGSNSIIKNNIVSRGRNAGIFIAGQNNLIENNDVSKIIQPKPHSSGGDANCMSFFGSGHTFRGNYCHDIYSDGVLVTDAHIDAFQTWNWISMGGVGHDVLFEKNILMYPTSGQGIYGKGWNMEEGSYNITIKNNVILANLIVLIIDGNNISFLNNTFVGISNTSGGLHLRRTNVNMYNNIFAHQKQRVIENLELSSTIIASNNCYIDYGIILPANPGDVRGTNALFVNESLRDYHLQSGSPCKDRGTTLTTVTDDEDGITRPQGSAYDMGAYEYTGASCIPNCTGKACGDDGCGNSCGSCAISYSCTNFQCIAPTPTPTRTPTPVPPTPTRTPTPTKTPTPVPTIPTRTPTPAPTVTTGKIYYVSKTGNNSNGISWTTAWNELDQINWNIIQPGDTIEIDGGTTSCNYPVTVTDTSTSLTAGCGMVYQTVLTVGKSGQSGKEIVIKLSDVPGRNGTIRIWGGRTIPLPYCGQSSYVSQTARTRGITINNHDYITVDGRHWSGIMTYSTSGNGVHLYNADYITVKNVETFDNGRATTSFMGDGSWSPEKGSEGVGIFFTGYHQKFERIISHDNGNDSFQSYGPMGDLILERVWAFNSRSATNDQTEAFSACTHSDGLQIWNGGLQSGILCQNSIIGPGFNQGFILGDYGSVNATIDNVTIRNTTFLSHHGPWSTAALYTDWASGNSLRAPQNYLIENVTVVRDKDDGWWSAKIYGSNHTIKNSLFYGIEHGIGIQTNVQVAGSPVVNNNICYRVNNSSSVCNINNVNPNFVDDNYTGMGVGFADFDFTITNPAIPSGIGSSITSVADLLGDQTSCVPSCTGKACGDDGCGSSCGSCAINYSCTNFQCIAPTPTPTRTPTPVPPTPTRIPTPTPTKTPTPIVANATNIIPARYRINWQPGIPGGIPNYPIGVNAVDYGANGNDQEDDTVAIKNAIAAVTPNTAVFIPQGTYYINSTITINKSNIAIRGEGFNKTKLIFNANSKLFEFNSKWGCSSTSWVSATGGLEKGSTSVTVSNPAQFAVGKYALIREDNDPDLYQCGYKGCETYGERAMGQVLKVKAVSGNTLTFTQPFNLTYKTTLNPLICANPMVEYTGIEDLYVEQQQSSGSGSNFHFHDTAFCWLKNVWSEKTLTAHVFFDTAFGNEIRGSVFNDSFLHNSGGQGYGIRTEAQSTANLIEDNIFNHLRHSMVVALGANGNVFGYNYSRNPYTSQSPNWLSNDIAIHGFYSYQNLFESNIVQLALIDNVWGSNGSTTIFRNRIEKDLNSIDAQINKPETFSFIQINENNPHHNIIGNEIGMVGASATKPINLNASIVLSTVETCNFSYQTQTMWGETNCVLPPSFYYTQKPAFLENLPWPLLGGDISPSSNILPAQQRYRNGTYIPSTASISPSPLASPQPSGGGTPKPGDANGDNIVNGVDYVVWLNHYNQSVSGATNGDFNNNGTVDGVDYVVWVNNYGT